MKKKISTLSDLLSNIIKDARTWMLCLALLALSIIPVAFPAITYANHTTSEWVADQVTSIYKCNSVYDYINFLDFGFEKICSTYLHNLNLFAPVFIGAAASAVILTFCLMAVIQAKEKA